LPLPPSSKPKKFSQIKTLIKEHVQLHQKEVVEELIEDNSFSNYERVSLVCLNMKGIAFNSSMN
jgi:hypothetical protein